MCLWEEATSSTDHRGLWGGDAQTLRQDAGVVGGARAVPQQLPVVQVLEGPEPLVLALANYFEDLEREDGCFGGF